MIDLRRFVLAAAGLAGALSAQATVFRGQPGGIGDVWVHPAPGAPAQRPAELQGIVLLPIDAAGLTRVARFLPDRPHVETDVPGASRLVLPHGLGVLYRYRRAGEHGTSYGFFHVGPDGLARALASFAGAGPAEDADPIPWPVALAPDGAALLVATTPEAGGDLFEIELESGAPRALTEDSPPLDFVPRSLVLLDTWGAAVARQGPMRFSRTAGDPELMPLRTRAARASIGRNRGVPLPRPLPFVAEGLVHSADGGTVAFVAGFSSAEAHVFAFGPSGPPVCVNDVAAPITGPGFTTTSGPWLALSPDGSRAAWKTADALGGECFSRRVTHEPVAAELHLTGDSDFIDTLNDTGVISFFDLDSVGVLVGEPGLAGGVEGADLYRVSFPAGGGPPSYSNLTSTSGDPSAPFLAKGAIDTTEGGMFRVPGGDGVLYYVDGSSGQGQLQRFDAETGTVDVLRTGVAELERIESAGERFVLSIEHDQPEQRELLAIPFDFAAPPQSLAMLPISLTLGPTAGAPDGTFATALTSLSGARLGQMLLPSGPSALLPLVPSVGPVLGFDGSGAVLASIEGSGRTWFLGWTATGALAIHGSEAGPGFVLPGN